MGFFDELKKLTRPYDDDEDEFVDESAPAQPAAEPARRSSPFAGGYAAEQSAPAPGARGARQPREGRVVSINGGAGHQTKLVLSKPERFDAAADIADHLREGHSIIMNLEATPKDVSRRLIDFLSGVAYALDGKVQPAAANTFVIVPKNADLSGDISGELEIGGTYF